MSFLSVVAAVLPVVAQAAGTVAQSQASSTAAAPKAAATGNTGTGYVPPPKESLATITKSKVPTQERPVKSVFSNQNALPSLGEGGHIVYFNPVKPGETPPTRLIVRNKATGQVVQVRPIEPNAANSHINLVPGKQYSFTVT